MAELADVDRTRFAAAMLRVVLALKRDPESNLDELIERVIGETGVDAHQFRDFLTTHKETVTRVVSRSPQ